MERTRGIVYVATGSSYIEEAKNSARSVRANTDLPIVLYTNEITDSNIFDEVHRIPNSKHTVADSVLQENMFPFDQNLFLDTDTYVCGDIIEIFELLDNYDIAMCQSPGKKPVPGLPTAFREFNTGVIAYQRNDDVKKFFNEWRSLYEKQTSETGHVTNQGTFSKALYDSDLDFITLPQEYNLRTRRGFAKGKAKIIHGRHPAGLSEIAEAINSSEKGRVFQMSDSLVGKPVHLYTKEGFLYRLQRYPFQFKNRVKRLDDKVRSGGVPAIAGAFRRFIQRRFTSADP